MKYFFEITLRHNKFAHQDIELGVVAHHIDEAINKSINWLKNQGADKSKWHVYTHDNRGPIVVG